MGCYCACVVCAILQQTSLMVSILNESVIACNFAHAFYNTDSDNMCLSLKSMYFILCYCIFSAKIKRLATVKRMFIVPEAPKPYSSVTKVFHTSI